MASREHADNLSTSGVHHSTRHDMHKPNKTSARAVNNYMDHDVRGNHNLKINPYITKQPKHFIPHLATQGCKSCCCCFFLLLFSILKIKSSSCCLQLGTQNAQLKVANINSSHQFAAMFCAMKNHKMTFPCSASSVSAHRTSCSNLHQAKTLTLSNVEQKNSDMPSLVWQMHALAHTLHMLFCLLHQLQILCVQFLETKAQTSLAESRKKKCFKKLVTEDRCFLSHFPSKV